MRTNEMRSQAVEKILRKICEEIPDDADVTLRNYKVKAQIVMDRDDTRSASVIRELINQ